MNEFETILTETETCTHTVGEEKNKEKTTTQINNTIIVPPAQHTVELLVVCCRKRKQRNIYLDIHNACIIHEAATAATATATAQVVASKQASNQQRFKLNYEIMQNTHL